MATFVARYYFGKDDYIERTFEAGSLTEAQAIINVELYSRTSIGFERGGDEFALLNAAHIRYCRILSAEEDHRQRAERLTLVAGDAMPPRE